MTSETLFLYGPPGVGKSCVGRILAEKLALPFWDVDTEIEARGGRPIPEIFAAEGEAGFREREHGALGEILAQSGGVIALGGGALTHASTRALAEAAGPLAVLDAAPETLLARLRASPMERPLLAGDAAARLAELLACRTGHYAGFPVHVDTTWLTPEQAAGEVQVALGMFRIRGMGRPYDVRVRPGALDSLGVEMRRRGLAGPLVLVSDSNVGSLYVARAAHALSGYDVTTALIPAGETYKTLDTVMNLWGAFLEAGVERGSTLVALGGGVVGDLCGFAAATYLRGVAWVNLPTTLLAMCDASLGGKTGADLPQGKNLVGAFHPPALVLADPDLLHSLPGVEMRNGLAEVVKHAIIGAPVLLDMAEALDGAGQGPDSPLPALVHRSMAVKIDVIEADPYEKGRRAALNLGHTIAHGIELASGFGVRHGEAVAMGMVAEARLAERLGLAEPGLAGEVAAVLGRLGLPTEIPPAITPAAIRQAIGFDKKKAGGQVKFSLPVRLGEVQTGVEVPEAILSAVIENQEEWR